MILAGPALECLTSCKTGSEIEDRELRLAAWNRRLDADVGVSEVDAVGLTFKNRAPYGMCRTGVPLPSKCCILYIFSANVSTEYFKHAVTSPLFSSKCRLFHNATFFGSYIIHILHTECAKI
jgi:hypothetical protein